jgi:hypothetical protein
MLFEVALITRRSLLHFDTPEKLIKTMKLMGYEVTKEGSLPEFKELIGPKNDGKVISYEDVDYYVLVSHV